MTTFCSNLLRWLVEVSLVLAPLVAMSAPGDLHLIARIPLPGTTGRLDHLAYAPNSKLLFVAGLEANTVQVVDVQAGRAAMQVHASEPQGLAYSAALHRMYIANGRAGTVEAFEGAKRVAVARELPDADNLRLDERSGLLYVGYGRALAALNTHTLAVTWRAELPGHPEAFEIANARIYVNVPSVRAVVVVDRATGALHRWSIAPAEANFPMAADFTAHRLFVATRRPARLLVLNTDTGQHVAELPICGDADDLLLSPTHQLYATCGDGHVQVILAGSGAYAVQQRMATADGARTGLLVPELGQLFVAAPARDGREAAVWVFNIE